MAAILKVLEKNLLKYSHSLLDSPFYSLVVLRILDSENLLFLVCSVLLGALLEELM
jgi:hypothetical protein